MTTLNQNKSQYSERSPRNEEQVGQVHIVLTPSIRDELYFVEEMNCRIQAAPHKPPFVESLWPNGDGCLYGTALHMMTTVGGRTKERVFCGFPFGHCAPSFLQFLESILEREGIGLNVMVMQPNADQTDVVRPSITVPEWRKKWLHSSHELQAAYDHLNICKGTFPAHQWYVGETAWQDASTKVLGILGFNV